MITNIIQFVNLIAYALVTSQPLFYLLAMSKAQKSMSAPTYIETRNLLDKHLQVSLRIVYYCTLVTSSVFFLWSVKDPLTMRALCSGISLIAFLIDLRLLLSADIPINKIISGWTPQNYPADWENYRNKWFYYYHRRQIADIVGFISLLVCAIFG